MAKKKASKSPTTGGRSKIQVDLIHGDVIEETHKIVGKEGVGFADVIVTSPPYNIGKNYGDGISDKRKPGEYLEWVDDWIYALTFALAENGSLFLNIGSTPKDPALGLRVMAAAEAHFKVQNVIHWVKSATFPMGASQKSIGHFKPINSNLYLNGSHEYVLHLTHTGKVPIHRKAPGVGVPYADESNIARWSHTGGGNLRCRGNVWVLPYKTIQNSDKQRPHPATFPVTLPEMAIRLHGGEDCSSLTVMDPFVGIGSTGVAACSLGVKRFIGIDISSYYLEETRNRINSELARLFF